MTFWPHSTSYFRVEVELATFYHGHADRKIFRVKRLLPDIFYFKDQSRLRWLNITLSWYEFDGWSQTLNGHLNKVTSVTILNEALFLVCHQHAAFVTQHNRYHYMSKVCIFVRTYPLLSYYIKTKNKPILVRWTWRLGI